MKKTTLLFLICGTSMILMLACENYSRSDWPSGPLNEQIDALADHHQGFARTMVEVSYRYKELYWAGLDKNWEYAHYQLEHMEEALIQGFERRPARKESARQFMKEVIPAVYEAIDTADSTRFEQAMSLMTLHCNTCHTSEEVPFFNVVRPEFNNSVIRLN